MEGFQNTTATERIFQLKKKIRAVSGGTSASKTISILVWIIDYAQTHKNKIVTVVGESVPHLNLGAKRDFKNIMISNKYWDDKRWAETGIYTFETGTIVEFISFDKFGKAHGPRRDVLFLNEANYLPYNVADQLITRTRSVVWLDWNPTVEFWFYTEMLGKREDVDFIGDGGNLPPLTYLDNEALDTETIKEIEAHRNNKSWWKVYGEGKMGEVEGRIYKGWNVIEEIPFEAKLIARWLDFGYTNDPSSIGDVYYYNGGYIVDEQLYQRRMLNKPLADFILSLEHPQTLVIADSAEPKSIDEIKSFGVNIVGVAKNRGESKSETFVKWSVGIVQAQKVSITRRSFNSLKEYRNYLWLIDKDGKILNVEDPKCANHSMSGIRYVLCTMVNNMSGDMEAEQADRLLSRLRNQKMQTR